MNPTSHAADRPVYGNTLGLPPRTADVPWFPRVLHGAITTDLMAYARARCRTPNCGPCARYDTAVADQTNPPRSST